MNCCDVIILSFFMLANNFITSSCSDSAHKLKDIEAMSLVMLPTQNLQIYKDRNITVNVQIFRKKKSSNKSTSFYIS